MILCWKLFYICTETYFLHKIYDRLERIINILFNISFTRFFEYVFALIYAFDLLCTHNGHGQ